MAFEPFTNRIPGAYIFFLRSQFRLHPLPPGSRRAGARPFRGRTIPTGADAQGKRRAAPSRRPPLISPHRGQRLRTSKGRRADGDPDGDLGFPAPPHPRPHEGRPATAATLEAGLSPSRPRSLAVGSLSCRPDTHRRRRGSRRLHTPRPSGSRGDGRERGGRSPGRTPSPFPAFFVSLGVSIGCLPLRPGDPRACGEQRLDAVAAARPAARSRLAKAPPGV